MLDVVISYKYNDVEFKDGDKVRLKVFKNSSKLYTKDKQVEFIGTLDDLKVDKFDIDYDDSKYITVYVDDVESMEKL